MRAVLKCVFTTVLFFSIASHPKKQSARVQLVGASCARVNNGQRRAPSIRRAQSGHGSAAGIVQHLLPALLLCRVDSDSTPMKGARRPCPLDARLRRASRRRINFHPFCLPTETMKIGTAKTPQGSAINSPTPAGVQ